MLHFESQDHLFKYYAYLDYEHNNYRLIPEDEDLNEAFLYRMDAYLGFYSLRQSLDDNSQISLRSFSDWEINLTDADMLNVLNPEYEISINDKYYKFIATNLITESTNTDQLDALRDGTFAEGTVIYDYSKGGPNPDDDFDWPDGDGPDGGGVIDFRSDCLNFMVLSPEHNELKLDQYIQGIIIDEDGNKVKNCHGEITIDWGDGHVTKHNGDVDNITGHRYDIAEGCRNFTITYSFEPLLCNGCGQTPTPKEGTITVRKCNPDAYTCIDAGKWFRNDYWVKYFEESSNRVVMKKQYKCYRGTLHRSEVYGEMKFQRYTRGEWRDTNLDSYGHMSMSIHGEICNDVCTNPPFQRNVSGQSNNSSYKLRTAWDHDIASPISDPMFIDCYITHTAPGTSNKEEFELINNDLFHDKEQKH